MCQQHVPLVPAPAPGLLGLSLMLQADCDAAPPNAGASAFVSPRGEAIAAGQVYPLLLTSCRWGCSLEAYVTAAALLRRSTLRATWGTLVRLFMTALSVAAKWQDDVVRKNHMFTEGLGVTTGEQVAMEVEFLSSIDFACYVSPQDYAVTRATCMEYERNALLSMGREEAAPAIPSLQYTLTRDPTTSIGLLFTGTRVIGVVPGSASEQAGLARNMVVCAVNGCCVATHGDVEAALRQAGGTVVINVCPPKPAPLPYYAAGMGFVSHAGPAQFLTSVFPCASP